MKLPSGLHVRESSFRYTMKNNFLNMDTGFFYCFYKYLLRRLITCSDAIFDAKLLKRE